MEGLLGAETLDEFRHGYGLDAIGMVRVAHAKSPGFSAFTEHLVAAFNHMLVDEHFGAPFIYGCVNLKGFSIGGRPGKLGMDFQQGRADDPCGLDQLTPRLHAALDKKVQGRGVHPFGEIRKENDAGRITVAEHHVDFIGDSFGHDVQGVGWA